MVAILLKKKEIDSLVFATEPPTIIQFVNARRRKLSVAFHFNWK